MDSQSTLQQKASTPPIPLPHATAVLVLGIIGILGCLCYGLPGITCSVIALVLSARDLRLYRASPSRYTAASYSNTRTGRICAVVGLILSLLFLLYLVVVITVLGFDALNDPSRFLQHAK